jgi:hypothetical protein
MAVLQKCVHSDGVERFTIDADGRRHAVEEVLFTFSWLRRSYYSPEGPDITGWEVSGGEARSAYALMQGVECVPGRWLGEEMPEATSKVVAELEAYMAQRGKADEGRESIPLWQTHAVAVFIVDEVRLVTWG